MDYRFFMVLGLSVASAVQAGTPILSIVSSSNFFESSHQDIPFDGATSIAYTVTNQSDRPQYLSVRLPAGVSMAQQSRFPARFPACINYIKDIPFAPKQKCILKLAVLASAIRSNGGSVTSGGPYISIGSAGFGTFQPAANDRIWVRVSPLNASVKALALSVNNPAVTALTGTPRKITLSSGEGVVSNVTFKIIPDLPAGATVSPANGACGNLTPNDSCTITITPGATPTGNTILPDGTPVGDPRMLTVFDRYGVGLLEIPIDILDYNSVYQSGYVFSVDDTTPDTESVGGKVAALENQAQIFPAGIIWASNGKTNCPKKGAEPYKDCTAYDFISGIDELSTHPPDACNGNTDGACNTQQIVSFIQNKYGDKTGSIDINTLYAAGLCRATIGEYSDWYLPAICELGYYQPTPNTPNIDSYCGTLANPLIQNMASNLSADVLKNMQGPFWSSTEFSCKQDNTCGNAWSDYFTSDTQTHDGKENTLGVRCVRVMTQPPSPIG